MKKLLYFIPLLLFLSSCSDKLVSQKQLRQFTFIAAETKDQTIPDYEKVLAKHSKSETILPKESSIKEPDIQCNTDDVSITNTTKKEAICTSKSIKTKAKKAIKSFKEENRITRPGESNDWVAVLFGLLVLLALAYLVSLEVGIAATLIVLLIIIVLAIIIMSAINSAFDSCYDSCNSMGEKQK